MLTLVDSEGHFCDTWQLRGGPNAYRCACAGGHVVPVDEVSAARVRAAHHLAQREPADDVITWPRDPRFERLVDPRDPDYVSDTFFHYRDKGVWVSVDLVQIPDSLYAEAKQLAEQHPDAAPQATGPGPG